MALLDRGILGGSNSIVIGGPGLGSTGLSVITSTVIANSGILQVGDVVAVTDAASGTGAVVRRYNTAGDKILGICVGFGRGNGQVPTKDSGVTPDRVTVESDNETDKFVYALVDVTWGKIWSAPSSATLDTTADARIGAFCDPNTGANAGQILESSMTVTQSTERGLSVLGRDPADTTRALVVVVEGFLKGANAAS